MKPSHAMAGSIEELESTVLHVPRKMRESAADSQ